MSIVLRHLGFCPVCQRDIKVRGGRLVHHGYERPGEGFIVGDCFAVDMPPHEVSPETAEAYMEQAVIPSVRKAAQEVERLKRDPAWMLFEEWDPQARGRSGYVDVKRTRAEVGDYKWDQKLNGLRYQAQGALDARLAEQRRVQKLIDTWQRTPLREVEEEERKAEQTRAERKAQVEADRAAKAAKQDAYSAATKAREAKRDALLRAFDAEFAALLARPPGPEREEAALLLLQESRKKEHKLDYPDDWLKAHGYDGFYAAVLTLAELRVTDTKPDNVPAQSHGWRWVPTPFPAREVSARLKALRGR